MSLFLGLDVGTQATKGLVIDAGCGAITARAARATPLLAGLPQGCAEQHPNQWIDAVAAVCAALERDGVDLRRVEALAVSGQQHGFVALDATGAPLRAAKLWCDTSTRAEAEELARRIGRPVPVGYTASKILWLARHEPALHARLRHVLLPHDYVNFVLTGDLTMEAGDASGTGFFDVRRRAFDPAAMAAVDPRLASWLPPLAEPGSIIGRVSAGAARRFGLAEGTPVATGGGDNMMAAIGAGATRPGVFVLSLGTSGTAFCRSDVPVDDASGAIAPFCDSTGAWLPLLCVMNFTGVTEEVRGLLGAGGDEDLGRLSAAARAVAPGAEGLTFLPYLVGERVPDLPAATGAILGVRPGALRPGALFRAALEGTSLNLALGIECMRARGLPLEAARVVGGGARNALWLEILAAVLRVPLQRLADPESAALGAAVCALWSLRRARGETVDIDAVAAPWARSEGDPVHPDPAWVDVYREQRERFAAAAVREFGPGADPRGNGAPR